MYQPQLFVNNYIGRDTNELVNGFKQLDEISKGDYQESLVDVVKADPQLAFTRITRLIGVSIKQPFATPQFLTEPSYHSHAYRTWELDPAKLTLSANTWQYQTLEVLRRELKRNTFSPPGQDPADSVLNLAIDAQHETGFFGYLGRSTAKYICDDPKLKQKIKDAEKSARASGFNTAVVSPNMLVQAGGVALATLLVSHIPVLAIVGAPVLSGIVLLIFTIGTDAFCTWLGNVQAGFEQ